MHGGRVLLRGARELSPGTYAKGQGRVARGGAAGVHAVCTQLWHWSEGRPVPFVPDVEGDLSGDRILAVSGWTRPAPRVCEGVTRQGRGPRGLRRTEVGPCLSVAIQWAS